MNAGVLCLQRSCNIRQNTAIHKIVNEILPLWSGMLHFEGWGRLLPVPVLTTMYLSLVHSKTYTHKTIVD